jgi:hypothetical protein
VQKLANFAVWGDRQDNNSNNNNKRRAENQETVSGSSVSAQSGAEDPGMLDKGLRGGAFP